MKLNYLIAIPVALLILLSLLCIAGVVFAGDLSENFDTREFTCKCCGEGGAHPELIKKLELLRLVLGDKPIIITSGYRCKKHNKHVGGVANSYHLLGMATDIKVVGELPYIVAQAAKSAGFSFTLIYDSWTHIDIRGTI